MIVDLDIIERTYCDCQECKLACKTMPGSLAPGDAQNIANYMHREFDCNFLEMYFDASSGTMVMTPQGPMTVPTIVPKQKANGECTFLTKDHKCSIHRVAPYGCRNFTVCNHGGDETEQYSKSAAQIAAILMESGKTYLWNWSHLMSTGNEAAPIQRRRGAFEKELNAMRAYREGEESQNAD